MSRNTVHWIPSLLTHLVIFVILCCFHVESESRPVLVKITSELHDLDEDREDFLDLVPDLDTTVSLETAVSLDSSSPASSVETIAPQNPLRNDQQELSQAFRREQQLSRPLAMVASKLDLSDNVRNLAGSSMTSGGDEGSVDRITLEILRQLDKSKVLVAWIMDASGSLSTRRENIIKRFDRIYHELSTLDKTDALLTGIVAFGQETKFVTSKPTDDQEKIKKAVRGIKHDTSGVENVFAAIKETALRWRRYQTQGRRTLMMVVLTDEIGDDQILLDDTADLVQRYRIPVYVMGPMAPFGRKTVSIRWTDEPTGETFRVPVERGPESVQPEHLAIPYWFGGPQYDLFPSGFGPYALTRIARDSGGIYFMFDDDSIPGAKFNDLDMMAYRPNYQSHSEYLRMLNQHGLRGAVIKAAQASEGALGTPQMRFPTERLNQTLQQAQRTVATTEYFAKRAAADLVAHEDDRKRETSRRWQAHYDLMMGRLLATKVRCNEYNWILGQMRTTPKTIKSKDKNAWQLVGSKEITFGKSEAGAKKKGSTNVTRADPKANSESQAEAEKALAYLRRVVEKHPGTPWGMMAQRELEVPLSFQWEETFIPPRPTPGQETPAQRAQQQRMQRRNEARKRIPKL